MNFSLNVHNATSATISHHPRGDDGYEWIKINMVAAGRDFEIVIFPNDEASSTAIREALAHIETEAA